MKNATDKGGKPPADTRHDDWQEQVVQAWKSRELTPQDLLALTQFRGMENDPKALKLRGMAHHYLGNYQDSEALLRFAFQQSRTDQDQARVLASLAAGNLRQGQYICAFARALRAIDCDESLVAPWLIAAGAAGHLGDTMLLEGFVEVFAESFEFLERFPEFIRALWEEPTLDAFTCSEPFVARLEVQAREAYERLLHEHEETSTVGGDTGAQTLAKEATEENLNLN